MPELPEVETVRLQIRPQVLQQQVLTAEVTRARAVRAHPSSHDFVARITGRTILEANRRGKAVLCPLDDGNSLLVRLGMSGRLMVVDQETPREAHTHVVMHLSNGLELRYIDPRTFGQVAVVDGHDPDRMIELGHYGPEPLGDAFTPAVLRAACDRTQALIQTVLMDQTRVVGIGKIYADEACFLAHIHPERRANSLTDEEITLLHKAIRDVLTRAILCRGTSTLDAAYKDAHGATGEFQGKLNVYQREGQPCRVCGTLVEFRPFQGRRMHFCPQCQQ